jgi:uncharacterized protein (TIGR03435 family)
MLRACCTALAVLLSIPAFAQDAPVAFEAATIKPTDPAFGGILVGFPGGSFSARGFTLRDLVAFAYELDNRQVVDVPKTLETDRYDITGKLPSGMQPNPATARRMLQALVADRFQVKFHRETREMPVYVLTVARGGHKMKPRTQGDGGEGRSMLFRGANVPGRDVTVAMLAEGLQKLVLDRPIVDKTGLTTNFDFDLTWRPEANQFNGRGASLPPDPDKPDIFTALQEQLGLKLDPQRGPAEVLVIDKAETPTEN